MRDDREKDFIRFARQTLEQNLQGMDTATCNRLAQARTKVVATRPQRWRMPMGPMGASIAIATTVALLIFLWPAEKHPGTQQLALEDINILASDVDMDVLTDPDFYRWLASYSANSLPLRDPPMGQGKARSAANG